MTRHFIKTFLSLAGILLAADVQAVDYVTTTVNSDDTSKQDVTYTFNDRDDAVGLTAGTDVTATVYSSDGTSTINLYTLATEGLERIALGASICSSTSSPTDGSWWWRSDNTNSGYTYQDGLQIRGSSYKGGLAILNLQEGDKVEIYGVAIKKNTSGSYMLINFPGASSVDGEEQTTTYKADGEASYTVTYDLSTSSPYYGTVTINVTSAGYVAAYVTSHNNGYIHTITITETATSSSQEYTIKYVDTDGNTLKESTTATLFYSDDGVELTDTETAAITSDGITYTYESYSIDGTTITITFEAISVNYTVNAVYDDETIKQIATGTAYNGSSVEVGLPMYIIDDEGNIYSSPSTSTTITIGSSDVTTNISYSLYSGITEGIGVFAEEGESISSLTAANASSSTYYGLDYGVVSAADTKCKITTLEAGNYIIITRFVGQATYTFYAGDDSKLTFTSKYDRNTQTLSMITLSDESVLYMSSSAASTGIDFILIAKINDYTKTIPSYLLASFSAAYSVSVPDGVYVYAATEVTSESVTLTLVDNLDVIPSNTGVILYSETEGDITLPITTSSGSVSISENYLVASSETPTAGSDDDGYTYYGLYVSDSSEAQFAQIKAGTVLSGNKAYLKVAESDSSSAKTLSILMSGKDSSTGISSISTETGTESGAYYNLQGIKVANPSKGLYIKDGKKIIIR